MKLSFRKKGRSVEQRFWDFVFPEPNTGCWLWVGPLSGSGYGRLNLGGGVQVQANRFSWELHNGKIKANLFTCHKCDVRCCVNPEHLFLGTQTENLEDMVRKGRDNPKRGEDHPRSKLTEQMVLQIRADSRSLTEIGNDYGFDKQYVWKIKNGWHWGHIK